LAALIGGLGVACSGSGQADHGSRRRTWLTMAVQRWNGDYGAKLIKMELD